MQLFPADIIGALGHELRTRAQSNLLDVRVNGKKVDADSVSITDFVKDGVHTTVVDFVDAKAAAKVAEDMAKAKAAEAAAALEGKSPAANGGVAGPVAEKAAAGKKAEKAAREVA